MRFKVVIPSYKRPDMAAKHPLLEAAHLVVPASQYEAYHKACGERPLKIVTHPDVRGLSRTRNFILSELYEPEDDFMFMVDDDIDYVRFMMSFRVITYRTPKDLLPVIAHTARLAFDAGTNLFGYTASMNPREREAMLPFSFRAWIPGHAFGVIGREQRFDVALAVRTDVDFYLQTLQAHRFAVLDRRYSWHTEHFTRGGLAEQRTSAVMDETLDYLASKWGRGIVERNRGTRKSGEALKLNVNKVLNRKS